MLSACEECLAVFPADFPACPVCNLGTDWLCQTHDQDGPAPMSASPSSSVAVE